jgi:methylmalonyl-CoA/ethylmalonyl-CoA epimerase
VIRRLDHVAVLVRSTDEALAHFSDRLGLPIVSSECLLAPQVRLTYLSMGNAYLQLVEPIADDTAVAVHLRAHGEGLHHLCFGSDDPVVDASALSDGLAASPGSGRGRVSAFVPGEPVHGVRLECTAFDHQADVEQSPGALERQPRSARNDR